MYIVVAIFFFVLSPVYLTFSKEAWYLVGSITSANVFSLLVCLIGGRYYPCFADVILLCNSLCREVVVLGVSRKATSLDCMPRFIFICYHSANIFMLLADCVLFKSTSGLLMTLPVILLVCSNIFMKDYETIQDIGLCDESTFSKKVGQVLAFVPLVLPAIFAILIQMNNEMKAFNATEKLQKQQKNIIGLFEKQEDGIVIINAKKDERTMVFAN